jgi:hypothetical protein
VSCVNCLSSILLDFRERKLHSVVIAICWQKLTVRCYSPYSYSRWRLLRPIPDGGRGGSPDGRHISAHPGGVQVLGARSRYRRACLQGMLMPVCRPLRVSAFPCPVPDSSPVISINGPLRSGSVCGWRRDWRRPRRPRDSGSRGSRYNYGVFAQEPVAWCLAWSCRWSGALCLRRRRCDCGPSFFGRVLLPVCTTLHAVV